jgi:Cysteine-rich secretory protein family
MQKGQWMYRANAMLNSNRRFGRFVNSLSLIVAVVAIAGSAQSATRKRPIKAKPIAVVVDPFRAEMLRGHNDERLLHGRSPLVWDSKLATDAAAWASRLANSNRFEHAFAELQKNGQGENLWMGTRGAYRFTEMLSGWIEEAELTKSGRFPGVSKTGNWADVGHFTQLVWPSTQKVGCALKSNAQDDYLVCRYWPAGNRIGEEFTIHPRK